MSVEISSHILALGENCTFKTNVQLKNSHRQFRVGKQTAGILLCKGIANV